MSAYILIVLLGFAAAQGSPGENGGDFGGQGGPGGQGADDGQGGLGGFGGPLLPLFLANLSSDAVQSFLAIFNATDKSNLTIASIKSAIESWAESQGSDVEALVEALELNLTALQTEYQTNLTTGASGLSAAITKICAISTNESLTFAQIQNKTIAYIQSLDENVARFVFDTTGGNCFPHPPAGLNDAGGLGGQEGQGGQGGEGGEGGFGGEGGPGGPGSDF